MGRFRSPLRNEWDAVAPQFEASAKLPGREGAMARLMLDIMPGFCDAVERERDNKLSPQHFYDAVGAICGAMIEEAIEQTSSIFTPPVALHRMLSTIQRIVGPRTQRTARNKLIIPEL